MIYIFSCTIRNTSYKGQFILHNNDKNTTYYKETMKLSTISNGIFLIASLSTVSSLPIVQGDAAVSKRDVPGNTLKEWWPYWNGVQEGSNAVIKDDCSGHVGSQICLYQGDWEQYTKDVVDKSIGGWVRIQFNTTFINGDNWHRVLQIIATALQEGSNQGKYIQVTLRPKGDDTTLGTDGESMGTYESAITQLVDSFKGFNNLVIDTANEASEGYGVSPVFVENNVKLIEAARNAGFEGFLAIEDWGYSSGLLQTSGKVSLFNDESALQQIKEANGGNTNNLIGSFHVYAHSKYLNMDETMSDEINTIKNAGFIPQIGEYGNFNDGLSYTPDAVIYSQKYQGLMNYYQGVTLSWNDQYLNSEGEIDTTENNNHRDLLNPDTHCYGYASGLQGCGQSVNYN